MSDMPAPNAFAPRAITALEYHRMGEVGIIDPRERVQLLGGRIVTMPPIGAAHAHRVRHIARVCDLTFGARALVSVQQPISLDAFSEPEPDIALLQPPEERYARVHPTASDTALVIEVADSSLAFDRGEKLRAYARGGVVDYWIVNLRDDVIEVYREPDAGDYRGKRIVRRDESVAPLLFPEITIAARDLLPRR